MGELAELTTPRLKSVIGWAYELRLHLRTNLFHTEERTRTPYIINLPHTAVTPRFVQEERTIRETTQRLLIKPRQN
jgi:hypothetical protein